jgi:hypothetical protein
VHAGSDVALTWAVTDIPLAAADAAAGTVAVPYDAAPALRAAARGHNAFVSFLLFRQLGGPLAGTAALEGLRGSDSVQAPVSAEERGALRRSVDAQLLRRRAKADGPRVYTGHDWETRCASRTGGWGGRGGEGEARHEDRPERAVRERVRREAHLLAPPCS